MLQIRVWPGFCPRTTGSIPRLTTTVSKYYELAAGFLIPGLSPTADVMTLVPKYDRLLVLGSSYVVVRFWPGLSPTADRIPLV
ncbi:hypothetical protein ACLKA6_003081 [Drosophila palustris]